MGKKKFRNPFQIGKRVPTKEAAQLMPESNAALAEYNARVHTRKQMAMNDELIQLADERDAKREVWMWGLFAVVLHRRYRFTAPKISEIFEEVQALHNELYNTSESEEELVTKLFGMVDKEVGLSIYDDDLVEVCNGNG